MLDVAAEIVTAPDEGALSELAVPPSLDSLETSSLLDDIADHAADLAGGAAELTGDVAGAVADVASDAAGVVAEITGAALEGLGDLL